MEPSPMQMYEPSEGKQYDNKENVVLRTLVGDPNRHTPLVEHRSPSTISSQEKPLASMYTLETRYQPISSKVLPKQTEPRAYYIDSKRIEEPPIINEYRDTPLPIQSEKQSVTPIVFLEPKIISQPIIYSIAGTKTTQIPDQPIPINQEQPSPTVYSITERPRRPTVDMSVNNLEVPTSVNDKSPTLYSLDDNPRFQNQIQEPSKQILQPSSNLYSIIGSPARTSRGVQVSTSDPIQPKPILYTIVGDTPVSTDRSKENRSTIKKQPTEATVYTLDNEANYRKIQQQQPIPKPKLYTLDNEANYRKTQQQPIQKSTLYTLDNEANYRKTQQQQPIPKPTLYTLGSKPISSSQENQTKPPARKKTPPPPQTTTITTRRISRSLERKPEAINEEIKTYPITKTKQQSQLKEPTIPLNEKERRPRQQVPEQTQSKPYTITQNQPIQLPDYRSPYAYRTNKPYRERKYNNNPLPVVSTAHSERKPRPPLYEPRYRSEQRNPYVSPSKATSSERYPIDTKTRISLWDNNGYQTQTDDDEEYEQKIRKKKQSYKPIRPRAPWIPVW